MLEETETSIKGREQPKEAEAVEEEESEEGEGNAEYDKDPCEERGLISWRST